MNCISPPGPEDHQLLAYLDSEPDPETKLHLQECAFCRERAQTLAHVQDVLASRLYRLTCPSATDLGEFYLRMLPPAQMLIVSQHLRACPHCTHEILQLKEFLSDLAVDQERNLLEQAKVFIARLVEGRNKTSTAGEMPFALRGEGREPLTFEVDGMIIVIDVQSLAENNLTILGQVAADNQDEWTGALVRWHQDHLLDLSTTIDDLGAFHCEDILPGSIDLQIVARNGTVAVVPTFEVSS